MKMIKEVAKFHILPSIKRRSVYSNEKPYRDCANEQKRFLLFYE